MRIISTANYDEMSKKGAAIIAAQVLLNPKSVLGLATGSTPIGIYDYLAKACMAGDLDFSEIISINLDEYCNLDISDENSYRYFMNHNLFSKININMDNTYVPDGLSDPDNACKNYDKLISDHGGIDLQLLGIGHNGHIAFNEPGSFFSKGTHCIDLSEETVNANKRFFESADLVPKRAITMGIRDIMQAKKVVLVVSGDEKKDIFDKSFFGPVTPEVPASILQLHSDFTVITAFS